MPQDFEIQHPRFSSSTNLCAVPFALNGQPISNYNDPDPVSSLQVSIGHHAVDLAVQTYCTSSEDDTLSSQRAFFFNLTAVDEQLHTNPDIFTVVVGHSEPAQVLINSGADDQSNCASALASVVNETSSIFTQIEAIPKDDDIKSPTDIDLVEKVLRRRLYEQATRLRNLTKTCRQPVRESLSDCRSDISCIAKVMCQRIHDTTLSKLKEIQESLQDSIMTSKHRQDQYVVADTDDDWDFDVTSVDDLLSGINKETDAKEDSGQHPVVIALEILAAALGLSALIRFLHRRFCSLRRRVERLADREERRRARHFRALARKEALRKKWVSFKQVFKRSSRTNDYEEKRALVVEAAGGDISDYSECSYNPANDPEMGQVIGDLARAHDFVAGIVQTRARKASAATLPSYSSEKLPDYTSTPDSNEGVANGFNYAPSSAGSGSVNTGITPDSSVVLSPRCSRETLRTGTDFSSD